MEGRVSLVSLLSLVSFVSFRRPYLMQERWLRTPSFIRHSLFFTRVRKEAETCKLRAWLAKSGGKIPQAATFALAMHLANNLH